MGLKTHRRHLKGFTIAELLVVLVLTSISITLSYSTLTQVQKLFRDYKRSNKFLNEWSDLKKRLDYESIKAEQVTEVAEHSFRIRRDTTDALLEFQEKLILLKRNNHCDTFHIEVKNLKKKYESMQNPLWTNKLVKELHFETEYSKQKFNFSFTKEHSASLKLKLDQH